MAHFTCELVAEDSSCSQSVRYAGLFLGLDERDGKSAVEETRYTKNKKKQKRSCFYSAYMSVSTFEATQRVNTKRTVTSPLCPNVKFEDVEVDQCQGLYKDMLSGNGNDGFLHLGSNTCISRTNVICYGTDFYQEIIDICDQWPDEDEIILGRLHRQKWKIKCQQKGDKLSTKIDRVIQHIDCDTLQLKQPCSKKIIQKLKVNAAQVRKELRYKEQCTTQNEKAKMNVEKSLKKKGLKRTGIIQPSYCAPVVYQSHQFYPANKDLVLTHQNGNTHTKKDTNSFVSLQYREITPEDYDLLLLLDESLAPKTVSKSKLKNFKICTVDINSEGLGECCICMGSFIIGQARKILPKCGHSFHELCIDQWLISASNKCPLDGSEV